MKLVLRLVLAIAAAIAGILTPPPCMAAVVPPARLSFHCDNSAAASTAVSYIPDDRGPPPEVADQHHERAAGPRLRDASARAAYTIGKCYHTASLDAFIAHTGGLPTLRTATAWDGEVQAASGHRSAPGHSGSAAKGVTGAYDEALAGGKCAGFLKNYLIKPTTQIDRGITSIERQIAEHQARIRDPAAYIDDWGSLDPRQQQALLNSKWPGDIARQQEQFGFLRGIFGSR